MNMKCGVGNMRHVHLVFQAILAYWLVGTSAIIRVPKDSGCLQAIKNYGCYCSSGQRRIPTKCNELFDEELLESGSGFPVPTTLTFPNLGGDLQGINMTTPSICVHDKFCES